MRPLLRLTPQRELRGRSTMTKPKRNSTRDRRICFDAHKTTNSSGRTVLVCHVCGGEIDIVRGEEWEADHIARHAEGGESTPQNLWPAHVGCHLKKSKVDNREVKKGVRIAEKATGVRRSARPMMGSKRSGWKKKMDGSVVRRWR